MMYYAAYGSNINLKQMNYRCPNSKIVDTGYLVGWKLYFNIYASVEYTGNKKDVVPVLVWEIADEDWEILDMYEGYPKYYTLATAKTKFSNGKIETCIIYIMTDYRGEDYIQPSEEYIEKIVVGYLENGLNIKQIVKALEYSNKKRFKIIKEYYNKGMI